MPNHGIFADVDVDVDAFTAFALVTTWERMFNHVDPLTGGHADLPAPGDEQYTKLADTLFSLRGKLYQQSTINGDFKGKTLFVLDELSEKLTATPAKQAQVHLIRNTIQPSIAAPAVLAAPAA